MPSLLGNDDRTYRLDPGMRSTMLRVQAQAARKRAWLWWLAACAIGIGTLIVADAEGRLLGLALALVPGLRGLVLFLVAQDLLDDSTEIHL